MNISQLKRLMAVALLSAVVFGNGCDPRMASEILNVVMQGMMMANQIGAMAQMSSPSQGSIVNTAPVHWVNGGITPPQVVKTNTFYEMDDKGNAIKRDINLLNNGATKVDVKRTALSNIKPVRRYGDRRFAQGEAQGHNNFVTKSSWGEYLSGFGTKAWNGINSWFDGKPNTVKTQVVKKPEVKSPVTRTQPVG